MTLAVEFFEIRCLPVWRHDAGHGLWRRAKSIPRRSGYRPAGWRQPRSRIKALTGLFPRAARDANSRSTVDKKRTVRRLPNVKMSAMRVNCLTVLWHCQADTIPGDPTSPPIPARAGSNPGPPPDSRSGMRQAALFRPSNSPGPRSFRSASAMRKPSFVSSKTFKRWRASPVFAAATKMQ